MINHQTKTIKLPKLVTRSQLKGYGTSSYHARIITKNLIPVTKQKRANAYLLNDVITALKDYLKRPRIKTKSRENLRQVLKTLLERLGNVLVVPFHQESSTHPEISQLAKQLTKAMSDTDRHLAELKANVATINGKSTK